ncbi:hypothetical protein [Pseudomonas sp. DG56-2]|uniref:hypothetical protein n=1 Tax=Pseudomonas sp. DG56-2 TaxID=2320270 RepID=UPI001C498D51|nr:hypothetical protein [Pseudomonas sp. DG56-2]
MERIKGKLNLMLALPHAADAPGFARFPVDIHSPVDGPVQLPGLDLATEQQPAVNGIIDWSQVITLEMKVTAAAE